jgi:hypothetical protein
MQPATTSLVEFELATAGASTLSLCKNEDDYEIDDLGVACLCRVPQR